MRVRENLSGIVSSIGKNNAQNPNSAKIGKVFGVITTLNTPTKELFENEGGFEGTGTIFYLDYESSKNLDINNVDLKSCVVAKPFRDDNQNYPLIGELVEIIDAPAPASQVGNNIKQKYYTGVVNIWNNPQQNSLTNDSLGKTFIENNDIRKIVPFEGDRIYQGRKGNGLRFGSTVKSKLNLNEWSNVGEDGDPITILVNGYVTTDSGSNIPNVEEINKELSSIYLTSTQQIPLIPDRNDILNPITKPLQVNKYFGKSQLLFNSDRLVLNSKKDEVMIFAKTNIEISTNNVINLNAGERTHLNSPKNFIGTGSDGTLPTEPLLLGNKTAELLSDLMKALSDFGSEASSVVTPPAGSPLVDINTAGVKLTSTINNLLGKLEKILSKQNYTS
jgi:hypothetical protein